MPRQNRVTPFGELVAVPERGTVMGNRGCLHDDRGRIRRPWQVERWLVCVLEFRGRQRQVSRPGYYTELFFLDEATALAAGHRPCFECRRRDAEHFAALWGQTRGWPAPARAPEMDEGLHPERVGAQGQKITYRAQLSALPDGTFVRLLEDGASSSYLIEGNNLLAWSPAGYGAPMLAPKRREVEVLTPRSIVAVLSAGYRPMLHPSAAA